MQAKELTIEGSTSTAISWWRFIVFLLLLALTLYFCFNAPDSKKGKQSGINMELPNYVLGYFGTPEDASEVEKKILPPDTSFSKMQYKKARSPILNLGIVLSGEDQRSIHKPEICLDGQGWNVISATPRIIELDNKEKLEIMDLYLSRQNVQPDDSIIELEAHYLYWFVGNTITTPFHHRRIIYSSLDNVILGVNHRWAYVSLMAVVPDSYAPGSMNNEETLELMNDFLADSVPTFQKTYTSERSWSKLVPFL